MGDLERSIVEGDVLLTKEEILEQYMCAAPTFERQAVGRASLKAFIDKVTSERLGFGSDTTIAGEVVPESSPLRELEQ